MNYRLHYNFYIPYYEILSNSNNRISLINAVKADFSTSLTNSKRANSIRHDTTYASITIIVIHIYPSKLPNKINGSLPRRFVFLASNL